MAAGELASQNLTRDLLPQEHGRPAIHACFQARPAPRLRRCRQLPLPHGILDGGMDGFIPAEFGPAFRASFHVSLRPPAPQAAPAPEDGQVIRLAEMGETPVHFDLSSSK